MVLFNANQIGTSGHFTTLSRSQETDMSPPSLILTASMIHSVFLITTSINDFLTLCDPGGRGSEGPTALQIAKRSKMDV